MPEVRKPHEYEIYQRGEKDLRPGMWTFRIDGQETHYYSPKRFGVERIVTRISKGTLNPGGVELFKFGDPVVQAMRDGNFTEGHRLIEEAERKLKSRAAARENEARALAAAPSLDPRKYKQDREDAAIQAFLTRGKLSQSANPNTAAASRRKPGPPSKLDVLNGLAKEPSL